MQEKARPRTGSLCACVAFTLFMFGCQYLTTPPSSPEISQFSLWLQTSERMALSCACRIVSKLNEVPGGGMSRSAAAGLRYLAPFHSVNSPIWEPVSRRRPSGVHATTSTAARTLFMLTCTNLVAKLVAGVFV